MYVPDDPFSVDLGQNLYIGENVFPITNNTISVESINKFKAIIRTGSSNELEKRFWWLVGLFVGGTLVKGTLDVLSNVQWNVVKRDQINALNTMINSVHPDSYKTGFVNESHEDFFVRFLIDHYMTDFIKVGKRQYLNIYYDSLPANGTFSIEYYSSTKADTVPQFQNDSKCQVLTISDNSIDYSC
ncbi:hypothetical protein BB561_006207 [Smittium simulii]|uniref:Uncharacterized protein n=1 Tax=Smittium simulii TaxID=133385 RepID=A0A2T9Y5U7_9FUNG|nr:hypothetical protein BB561_006207 [Smittium simulii]